MTPYVANSVDVGAVAQTMHLATQHPTLRPNSNSNPTMLPPNDEYATSKSKTNRQLIFRLALGNTHRDNDYHVATAMYRNCPPYAQIRWHMHRRRSPNTSTWITVNIAKDNNGTSWRFKRTRTTMCRKIVRAPHRRNG